MKITWKSCPLIHSKIIQSVAPPEHHGWHKRNCFAAMNLYAGVSHCITLWAFPNLGMFGIFVKSTQGIEGLPDYNFREKQKIPAKKMETETGQALSSSMHRQSSSYLVQELPDHYVIFQLNIFPSWYPNIVSQMSAHYCIQYPKSFSLQIFSAQEKAQLDVYGLLAVLRNQLQTDDSFVLNKLLSRVKESISHLPIATDEDNLALEDLQVPTINICVDYQ